MGVTERGCECYKQGKLVGSKGEDNATLCSLLPLPSEDRDAN